MIKSLFKRLNINNKEEFFRFAKQFFKFGVVGLSNTAISMFLYYLLVYLNVHYLLANLIGFVVSVINAYYWNNKYVFKDKQRKHSKTFLRTFTSYGFTFLLGQAMLFLLVEKIGLSKYVAQPLTLIITIPMNFLMNKFWAFKEKK